MNRFLLSILSILIFGEAQTQTLYRPEGSTVPGTDYRTLHQTMADYYAIRGTKRGGGYKQFRRWEWFVGQRVDSTGHMPSGFELLREVERTNMLRGYRSEGDWTAIGPIGSPSAIIGYPAHGIGRITGLAFHPTDSNTMWTGAPAGGLWRTTDNGDNWQNMTPDWPNLGVGDIVINHLDPDTMYLASGDGSVSDTYSYGLLRSADAGTTWEPTGLTYNIPDGINFRRLALDPLQPHVMLAATNDGLKRSVNAAQDFVEVASGHYTDVQWMPGQSDTVFASTYSGGGTAKLFRSTDGGITWTLMQGLPGNNAGRIKVRMSPAAPRRVYALVSNNQSAFRGLWRSDDAGQTFQQMATSPNLFGWEGDGSDTDGTAWYAMDMAVSNVNADVIVVGSVSPWISTDGGATFLPYGHWSGGSAPYVHADQHRLAFHPITDRFYSANDGGLFRKAWTFNGFDIRSNGMNITQFYRMSHGTQDPDRILAGCQDNGTHRWLNGTWTIVYGGDGMEALIHPTNGNVMYCTTQGGTFHRSTDAGFSFSNDLSPNGGTGQWVTPFLLDPSGEPVIYAAWSNQVFRSDDNGSSWFEFSTVLAGGDVTNMRIADSDPDVMYVTTGTRVYRTSDLGGTWDNISVGLPSFVNITGLAIDPFDANTVWITYSGYTDGKKVYRSTDAGQTWQNMSFDMPNLPANCVIMEKSPEGGVYVGTDAGVFYWQEGATEWIPFMNNLPNVIVSDMELSDVAQKLRIATYGRGIWESPLMHGFNVGVKETWTRPDRLQIRPVPATDAITVDIPAPMNGKDMQLCDAYGRVLRSFRANGPQMHLDVRDLGAGTYFISTPGTKAPVGKFLVVR